MPFAHETRVTIQGSYVLLDGTPAAGKITFSGSPVLTDFSADQIIYPVPLTVTLDSNGFFTIDLPATNDPYLTPSSFRYLVTEVITGGGTRSYTITVPYNAVGPLNIVDLGPNSPQPPVAISDDATAFALVFGS